MILPEALNDMRMGKIQFISLYNLQFFDIIYYRRELNNEVSLFCLRLFTFQRGKQLKYNPLTLFNRSVRAPHWFWCASCP